MYARASTRRLNRSSIDRSTREQASNKVKARDSMTPGTCARINVKAVKTGGLEGRGTGGGV